MARPSGYTEQIGDEIVQQYANGKTLTDISRQDGMPDRNTIRRWMDCFPAFGRAMAQAREDHIETTADEMQIIADTDVDPQRARNRIDVRRWRASKMKPETYGDRVDMHVNHTVSISEALAEARKRVRPMCDLEKENETQVIEVPYKNGDKASDTISGALDFDPQELDFFQ